MCEEGPGTAEWATHGSQYSGGLGWLHATWDMFKTPDDPADMGDATIDQQVAAGVLFQEHYGELPDQSGCGNGY